MHVTTKTTSAPAAFLRGRLYVDSVLIDPSRACDTLTDGDFSQFQKRIAHSRGKFALIVVKGGELWAAVDRVRSTPLFYGIADDDCFVSTDPYWVRERVADSRIDPQAATELWYMLYVLRDGTLSSGVKQLRPGEVLRVKMDAAGPQPSTHSCFSYVGAKDSLYDKAALLEELDRLHVTVFEELLASTQGRPIAVPLSGGLDSRLLACMLRRVGARDVFCFTYGRPGNIEVQTSREVAEFLGYPWLFVPYQRKDWIAANFRQARRRFIRYASQLCALPPLLEDWLAVGVMKRDHAVPPDTVFCPGHTAVYSAGRRALASAGQASCPSALARNILRANSPRLRWTRPDRPMLLHLQTQIERTLRELAGVAGDRTWNPGAMLEAWNWCERQTKRIINMVRAYEFWGYSWRIPLWDDRLMDFWAKIPSPLRLNKTLYRRYLTCFSESRFFGLFNGLRSDGATDPLPKVRRSDVLRRAFQRHSLGRYFLAEKHMEHLLAGSCLDFLHTVGRRIFSTEPVTSPWLLLEQEGIEGIWQ